MSQIDDIVSARLESNPKLTRGDDLFLLREGFSFNERTGVYTYSKSVKGKTIEVMIDQEGDAKFTYQFSPESAVIGMEYTFGLTGFASLYEELMQDIERVSYGNHRYTVFALGGESK